MLDLIFWLKTEAFIDIWFIQHFLAWMSLSFFFARKHNSFFEKLLSRKVSESEIIYFNIIAILFIAYFRESVEHYLEEWVAWPAIEYWFYWVEFWANRIIFDPLAMILWFFLILKFPKLVWPARFLSLTWIIVHIAFFPHSMYLQELMGF